MSRIAVLPESLASLVRAGEVVTSPARALSELVQNSLDAGAGSVEILASADGGYDFLQVSDDGGGMSPEELALAPLPHATSKTRTREDIESPAHFGFRGEALAAVARVSRLSLASRMRGGEGWEVVVAHGSAPSPPHPVALAQGTRARVEGLFSLMPVRRAMAPHPSRARASLRETLRHLALSSPRSSFRLDFEGDGEGQGLHLPAEGWEERARRLLPPGSAAIPVRGRACLGFLVPGRGKGLLCVAGRPVRRDAAVARALKALEGETGRAFSFHGRVDSAGADHNVHAAKEEVSHAAEEDLAAALLADFRDAGAADASAPVAPAWRSGGTPPPDGHAEPGHAFGVALSVLGGNFIVARNGDELVLVDAHAAAERVTLERLREGQVPSLPVPPLLVPSRGDAAAEARELERAGFAAQDVGGGMVELSAAPWGIPLTPASAAEALEAASEGLDGLQAFLARTACRTSFCTGDGMSVEDADSLLREMSRTPRAGMCPHGRPTVRRLDGKGLSSLFGR